MQRGLLRLAASVVCASLLAACGGGGAGSAVPVKSTQSQTANVAIALTFPSKATAAKVNGRHPNYIPSGTQGIGIDYAPNPSGYSNTSADAHPAAGSALVAGTAPCGSADSTGKYSCIIYLPAVPVGYNDFKVSLWNGQPSSCSASGTGCDFSAATALSTTVITDLAIKQGQNNNFSLGFAAEVDSVYVALSGGIVDGTSSSLTATMTLKDGQGFTIVNAPSLYDKNGNALSVSLNLPVNGGGSLSFAGGGSTVSFNSVNSSSNTINVNYDGTYQFASSGGSQPSVTASLNGGAINGSIVNSPLSVTQSNNNVGVPGVPQVALVGALSFDPNNITLGADNNLWISEGLGIEKMTTAGATTFTNLGREIYAAYGAPDGDVWFFDYTAGTLGHFTPPYTGAVYSAVLDSSVRNFASTDIYGLTAGADGFIYGGDAENDELDVAQPNNFAGITPAFYAGAHAPNSGLVSVTAGPRLANGDPTVCGTEMDYNDHVSASPHYAACFDTITHTWGASYALTGTYPDCCVMEHIVYAPDGKLYVAERKKIEALNVDSLTGKVTLAASYATSSGPLGLAVGNDGNVWFLEGGGTPGGGGPDIIGKIDVSSSSPSVTEYTAAQGTGMTAAGYPADGNVLVAGPKDSNKLYFADDSSDNVYSITP